MRALVTGATGFIGGALAAALATGGWQVNLLVRPGQVARLWSFAAQPGLSQDVTTFEADLDRDSPVFAQAAAGCQVVFHAAAIRNRWGTTVQDYWRVNVGGTRRVLDGAAGQATRFVYVSSVGVFGKPGVLGVNETRPPNPRADQDGYHSTKAVAEQIALSRQRDMQVVVVRPTITYGTGDASGMLTRLIQMIAAGKYLQVGSGRNHIHLTYIDDLVNGLLLAGEHPLAAGETLILAGPQPTQVGALVGLIHQGLDRGKRSAAANWYLPEPVARPLAWGVESLYRAGAALHLPVLKGVPPVTRSKIDTLCRNRGFSSKKAESLLGYVPQTGLAEGVEKTMAWLGAAGKLHRPAGVGVKPGLGATGGF